MHQGKIKISIVEDDLFIRINLSELIAATEGFAPPQCYPNADDFLGNLADDDAQIVLMDISMPGTNGIEAIKIAKKTKPDLEFIMLTVHHQDTYVFDALCAGASGYLIKDTPLPKIITAIKETLNGGAPMSSKIARLVIGTFRQSKNHNLTAREMDVLQLLCTGKSYKMIADSLFISKETVRTHIKHIYKKLEVHSNAEAVAKAYRDRII